MDIHIKNTNPDNAANTTDSNKLAEVNDTINKYENLSIVLVLIFNFFATDINILPTQLLRIPLLKIIDFVMQKIVQVVYIVHSYFL